MGQADIKNIAVQESPHSRRPLVHERPEIPLDSLKILVYSRINSDERLAVERKMRFCFANCCQNSYHLANLRIYFPLNLTQLKMSEHKSWI